MSLSVDDLFTAKTAPEIRADMVADLISLGVPADQWRSGGVASTILTVASMAMALFSTIVVGLIKGFFLPTATGGALRLLAYYIYGVTVRDASFATGNVTLTNSGGGIYNVAAGGYTCLNSSTNVTYTNDAAFSLGANTSVSVSVIATTAGSAGNAAPGAINANVTSLLGVTVTNASALVGLDEPTDEAIRQECLDRLGALGNRGVRVAYAYAVQVATNSVTGQPVNINRWSITSSSPTATVTTYVASPSGVPDSNDVTGVATSIEANARPEGVTAVVSAVTAVPYTRSITVWCKMPDAVGAAQTKTAIDSALVSFISTYPIGGITANDDANPSVTLTGLFSTAVYGEIATAVSSLGGTLMSAKGATDMALTPGQVATDAITITVRLITNTSGTTVS